MNLEEFKEKLFKNTVPSYISKGQAIEACRYAYSDPRMRPNRFNGLYGKRSPKKIDNENFRGKIAEFAVYNMFVNHGIQCTTPNTRVWKYGADKGDLSILFRGKKRRIEIKSTKLWGKCLLLDKLKWIDEDGHIINHDHSYDYEKNQIPYIFISVNVDDRYSLLKNFHQIKCTAKRTNNFKLVIDKIPSYINKDLKINVMGMISGTRFINSALLGKRANLVRYIPTASKSKWSDSPSDVPNFAFPYAKCFLNKRAREEERKEIRHFSYTVPAGSCLKYLIKNKYKN